MATCRKPKQLSSLCSHYHSLCTLRHDVSKQMFIVGNVIPVVVRQTITILLPGVYSMCQCKGWSTSTSSNLCTTRSVVDKYWQERRSCWSLRGSVARQVEAGGEVNF